MERERMKVFLVIDYGWSEEEARAKARRFYDEKVGPGYRKLTAEIDARKKALGIS